jgi:hypothetical protein
MKDQEDRPSGRTPDESEFPFLVWQQQSASRPDSEALGVHRRISFLHRLRELSSKASPRKAKNVFTRHRSEASSSNPEESKHEQDQKEVQRRNDQAVDRKEESEYRRSP